MTTKPPRVALFDLGGVFVMFKGFDWLSARLDGTPDVDEVRARWLGSPLVRSFEAGDIGAVDFAEQFVGEWELDLSPTSFITEFRSWVDTIFPGSATLLRHLRESTHVACLSNTNRLHWEVLHPTIGAEFDSRFLSFETGLLKPDPESFIRVLTTLDVEPHEVVFFDDAPENVVAATRLGIRAKVVERPVLLALQLNQAGF